MLFMVIEHFHNGNAIPVYQRFRERGRLAPDQVKYVASWVTHDLAHCYQVMECPGRAQLDVWLDAWRDLVDFEVIEVMTSPDAVARVTPYL